METVVAVIDVGKTNKKLFLFNQNYQIVYERSARFIETEDEDGMPCENLESLRLSVFDSLRDVFNQQQFHINAVNFSAYGASLVYIGKDGKPLTPLYNYLKPYPAALQDEFYELYGGVERFSEQTASPALGSLNSGLQLYRIKKQKPEIFKQVKYALHLPQYLSYLLTGKTYSDITSIGCHTALWDFRKNKYHNWVVKEGLVRKLAPVVSSDKVFNATFPGNNYLVGTGLHDSSAALIPYLMNFHEPFILISTGTWCISLNPFNHIPLTIAELEQDCLCYMNYRGQPVKASRLFAGFEHEEEVKKIAAYFDSNPARYRKMRFRPEIINRLKKNIKSIADGAQAPREWSCYKTDEEAYHQLMMDIVAKQHTATQLVLAGTQVKRIFVDGGFSKNMIFMNLLAAAFPDVEIFAASMAQATAVGAALAIHRSWNPFPVPNDIIELKYYSVAPGITG